MARRPFETGTPDVDNCLLGDKGKSRNVPLCEDRRTCKGCGWDKKEHQRRLNLIHYRGLTPISEWRLKKLRTDWGMDTSQPIIGAHIGKRQPDGDV